MHPIVLTVGTDGTTSGIYTDVVPLSEIGTVTKTRASHVEPCDTIRRLAFHSLRFAFGESGRVAAWTRSWACRWQVRWPGQRDASFAHNLRAVCIEWEVEQLNRRLCHECR